MSSRSLPSESWFGDSQITAAVQSLRAEASQAADDAAGKAPPPKPDDVMPMVMGVVIVIGILLLGLVAVLFLFAPRKPDQQLTPFGVVRAVGIIALVLGGGALATKYYQGQKWDAAASADALQQVAARAEGLRPAVFAPITGLSVGSVPWLVSEIDMPVNCELQGSYQGHPLALLECTYVLDVTLSKLEASMGKLAAKIMSHVEHEGVQRRSSEAIVFFQPLAGVPDLFLAPREEPLHWYFEKQLQKAGAQVELNSRAYWLASSDADRCAGVFGPAVERALRDHPAVILQVFSGYCIVISATWNFNWPTDMPCQEEQIEKNLKLACTLYEALGGNLPAGDAFTPKAVAKSVATPVRPAALPEPDSEPAAPVTDIAPSAPSAPAAPRSWHRLIGACVGALLLGGLTLAVEVPHYPPEKMTFAHLLGNATFPMMIGAVVGLYIGHRIQRNTWRRLVPPGIGALLCGGVALAFSIPNRPAEQINFAFLLAYSLFPMIFGGAVGALIGWLIRRGQPIPSE